MEGRERGGRQQLDEDWGDLNAGPAECSPDLYQLKGTGGRDLLQFPVCTQLGSLLGARPVQGRQVGSANWIFYFYIKTLCLKFLQRTNSMGFR